MIIFFDMPFFLRGEYMNNTNSAGEFWKDSDVIYAYTRAQAIEDGQLIDVSEMAREAGVRFPVAVTASVWHTYVVPDERSRKYGQSEQGRLWDILWLLRCAIRSGDKGDTVTFQVRFIMKEKQLKVVMLKAVCGPGDDLEPVITIMPPDED